MGWRKFGLTVVHVEKGRGLSAPPGWIEANRNGAAALKDSGPSCPFFILLRNGWNSEKWVSRNHSSCQEHPWLRVSSRPSEMYSVHKQQMHTAFFLQK